VKGILANGVDSQSNAVYVDLVLSIEVAVEVCCGCVTFHCMQLLSSC